MSRLDAPVPEHAYTLAGLSSVDYADAWAIEVTEQRSPLEWMQIAIEGNARLMATVRIAHRALALKLAAASAPEHPLGWRIAVDHVFPGISLLPSPRPTTSGENVIDAEGSVAFEGTGPVRSRDVGPPRFATPPADLVGATGIEPVTARV